MQTQALWVGELFGDELWAAARRQSTEALLDALASQRRLAAGHARAVSELESARAALRQGVRERTPLERSIEAVESTIRVNRRARERLGHRPTPSELETEARQLTRLRELEAQAAPLRAAAEEERRMRLPELEAAVAAARRADQRAQILLSVFQQRPRTRAAASRVPEPIESFRPPPLRSPLEQYRDDVLLEVRKQVPFVGGRPRRPRY